MSKVLKAFDSLRASLAYLAREGYEVAGLSADRPNEVQGWCSRTLRAVEPQTTRGHRLSRRDAEETADAVTNLQREASRAIHALAAVEQQHEANIAAHNRRARARLQERRGAARRSAERTLR